MQDSIQASKHNVTRGNMLREKRNAGCDTSKPKSKRQHDARESVDRYILDEEMKEQKRAIGNVHIHSER